jgi:hypothetical protein
MTTQSHRPGIPRSRSKLFGRTDDASTVRSLLDRGDSRIITLTGPGGVGKTRLASRVALRYGWSVVYVRLESVHDPGLVLSAIAARLGVRDGGDQPLLDQLATVLDEQDVLLVLDNFEQVLESGATIGELVDRCPHLRVLITSRSRLRIQGEQVYRVQPLPVSACPGSSSIVSGPVVTRPSCRPNPSSKTSSPSAIVSMACPWPSSLPPRGCRHCHCRGWSTGSIPCCPC